MEYTYEFLRNCHGLRFRATICNKPQEGVIKVTSEGVILCYGEEDPGYLVTFGRRDSLSFSEQTFSILPNDFEIVPRDPEKYTDWQVGDMISKFNENNKIVFRGGDLVFFKAPSGEASGAFTYRELFEAGYRLVRTDVEKQIIEERKKPEWKPQDGDVCYSPLPMPTIFIKEGDEENHRYYKAYIPDKDYLSRGSGRIVPEDFHIDIRPATDAEKQRLFDALAKNGMRWNAEKKVIEDIEPESDEPVDVQKMIADALEGYVPKGHIEGFPLEVIAKMLERQYEQSGKIDLSNFERNRVSVAPLGFDWVKTEEGAGFWNSVIYGRDFSEFFKRYPKNASTGDSHTFREGEPVLVRDNQGNAWELLAFVKTCEDTKYHYEATDGFSKSVWRSCIPYNEKTMHLLGTTDNYEEK